MSLTRDAKLVAGVALWVGVVLGLDTGASLTEQRLLGLFTWAVLLVALRGEGPGSDDAPCGTLGAFVNAATGSGSACLRASARPAPGDALLCMVIRIPNPSSAREPGGALH